MVSLAQQLGPENHLARTWLDTRCPKHGLEAVFASSQGKRAVLDARIARRDALLLFGALGLAGCGRMSHDPGAIRIASSPTGVPFSFVDPWTNELTGSMVATAEAVAKLLGKTADKQVTPFSALIPSLTVGKVDMVAAAMLRTPEREQIVDFSDPVYRYTGALVSRRDDRQAYPNLAAITGRRVGVQVGTRFVDQLSEAGVKDVATYDGLSDILRDLGNGRIDLGYGDEPILKYQLRVGPKRDAKIVAGFKAPALEELCLIVRRGDPLLPAINAAIHRLGASVLPAISKHWGLD